LLVVSGSKKYPKYRDGAFRTQIATNKKGQKSKIHKKLKSPQNQRKFQQILKISKISTNPKILKITIIQRDLMVPFGTIEL
jgi:hypothetical protein